MKKVLSCLIKRLSTLRAAVRSVTVVLFQPKTVLSFVADTTKNADKIYLHSGKTDRGVICAGDTVKAAVHAELRDMIKRNHTAAHLLQAALREVLRNAC